MVLFPLGEAWLLAGAWDRGCPGVLSGWRWADEASPELCSLRGAAAAAPLSDHRVQISVMKRPTQSGLRSAPQLGRLRGTPLLLLLGGSGAEWRRGSSLFPTPLAGDGSEPLGTGSGCSVLTLWLRAAGALGEEGAPIAARPAPSRPPRGVCAVIPTRGMQFQSVALPSHVPARSPARRHKPVPVPGLRIQLLDV